MLLWLVVGSHVIFSNQSDCFNSAWHRYATLKNHLWHWVRVTSFSFFTDRRQKNRRQKILKLIFRKSRWWISVEKNNLRFVAKWNKSIGVIKKRAGWGRFNKTFSVLQLTSCKFAIELFLVEVREVDLRWNCSFGYSNIWSFTSRCVFERITN